MNDTIFEPRVHAILQGWADGKPVVAANLNQAFALALLAIGRELSRPKYIVQTGPVTENK
jgi:hypothetical protein